MSSRATSTRITSPCGLARGAAQDDHVVDRLVGAQRAARRAFGPVVRGRRSAGGSRAGTVSAVQDRVAALRRPGSRIGTRNRARRPTRLRASVRQRHLASRTHVPLIQDDLSPAPRSWRERAGRALGLARALITPADPGRRARRAAAAAAPAPPAAAVHFATAPARCRGAPGRSSAPTPLERPAPARPLRPAGTPHARARAPIAGPQRRTSRPEGGSSDIKPAASYSPGPLRAKYHRR